MTERFGFKPGRRPEPPPGLPVYSLITMVRDAAGTIERTLDSVARQTYPAIEYIVADAGSTDGTAKILSARADLISHWCSEPDRCRSDGANKGVLKATGAYVGFVYADDWLPDDFVERTMAAFARTGADFVFGDQRLHRDGVYAFTVKGDPDYAGKMHYRAPSMNFPSLSAAAHVYRAVGLYDETIDVAPDHDWLFRVHRAGFRGHYDPSILYDFSFGGHSTRHFRRSLIETARACVRHGGDPWRAWAYALVKVGFHSVDDVFRDHVPITLYARVRSWRKSITG